MYTNFFYSITESYRIADAKISYSIRVAAGRHRRNLVWKPGYKGFHVHNIVAIAPCISSDQGYLVFDIRVRTR
jgi:hypothetical protein